MSTRKSLELSLTSSVELCGVNNENQELFEACKTGDLTKVKKYINSNTVNARDISGRKSTPLHFASGMYCIVYVNNIV